MAKGAKPDREREREVALDALVHKICLDAGN